MSRLETGVVQPEGDWPGVFIRGDNAFALAQAIRHVVAAVPEGSDFYLQMSVRQLESLGDLLQRSNRNADNHRVDQTVNLNT